MSKPVLPLGGASFNGLVAVTETGPLGMITVRGDLSSEQFQSAITALTGTGFPDQRKAEIAGEKAVLWMSPDELLVLVSYDDANAAVAQLREALAGTHFMAENVSDMRAAFTLKGDQVRDVVAKIAPVDMSSDQLVPGDMRRTRFAQIAAGFWMVDETTVQIVCFRSVGEYMFNLLSVAADPAAKVGYHSA
jgi:sarcosine oxidase subunit gamma